MSSHVAWLAVIIPIGLCGCVSDVPSDPPGFAVRDSAGIEIVESSIPAWKEQAGWTLGDRPTVEIGAGLAGDSASEFANIVRVHRLASGSIAILDAWAPAVFFFDSTGGFLGRIGRHGTGPGEFPPRSVRDSYSCGGDTVFVIVGQRVAAYTSPGEYATTFTPEQPTRISACSGGAFIGEARYSRPRSSPGVSTDSILLVSFNRDGSLRSVIDTLPIQQSDWVTGPEGGLGYSRALFSPRLSITADDSITATGYGAQFEIEIRGSTGAVMRIVRVTGQERRVGKNDVDQFQSFVFSSLRGDEGERRRIEQQLAAAEGLPLPAFAELKLDRAGNLWARAFDNLDAVAFYDYSRMGPDFSRPTITEPRRWAVLDRRGRYLGVVETPPNFTVYEIGDDHVLGVWRDDLDIQYVRQYALLKPQR